MHMKIKFLIAILACLAIFILPAVVRAATSVNLFQITNGTSSGPYIYKNLVVYGSLGEIWGHDLNTQENFEILNRAGQQFVTDFSNGLVIYEDTPDSEITPDVRMYNVESNTDELIAGGIGAQAGGVTNGNFVIYIDGGACGVIHAYNIKKKVDSIISSVGCQPLHVSENIVVWPNGAPGGTNIYGYDLNRNKPLNIVIEDNFQEAPNIYKNFVVWHHYITGGLGDYEAIRMKNLNTGEIKTLYETTTETLGSVAVSDRYAIWSQSPSLHVVKVMGADLKTGEVFEVQPSGFLSTYTGPSIWKNTAVWNVYGAVFNR